MGLPIVVALGIVDFKFGDCWGVTLWVLCLFCVFVLFMRILFTWWTVVLLGVYCCLLVRNGVC